MQRGATAIASAVALALWLLACSSDPKRASVLGEAYAGPDQLKLRGDIPTESPTVATLHHGDRLEILEQRRGVFLRVRTASGAEGWIEARQLLSADEMAGLRDLAARARTLPSQGAATTFGDLRIHTAPSRTAPSFVLLKEHDKMDVLGYVSAPRTAPPRKPLLPPPPPKKPKAKAAAKPPKYPPPPPPPAPPPPANWQELSQPTLAQVTGESDDPIVPEIATGPASKEVPTDTWSLVRTARGECGWALARAIYLSIPDDVARYAEGHRIVSYYPLGEVRDGDDLKQEWLWTTSSAAGPHDFDSFRIFVWSVKRHRYETAHIERNVQGYLPVRIAEVEIAPTGKAKQQAAGRYSGFSVCVAKADGSRNWRVFAFLEPTVRFVREEPCEAPPSLLPEAMPAAAPAAVPAQPKKETLSERGKRWLQAITPRWLSKSSGKK